MVVKIKVEGLKEVDNALAKLYIKFPRIADEAAEEIAEELVGRMNPNIWTGNLMKSIEAKPSELGMTIYGLFYWRFLENGVIIRTPVPKLLRWAKEKAGRGSGRLITGMLKKGYTEPHPFVQPAVETVASEIDSIIQAKLDNLK